MPKGTGAKGGGVATKVQQPPKAEAKSNPASKAASNKPSTPAPSTPASKAASNKPSTPAPSTPASKASKKSSSPATPSSAPVVAGDTGGASDDEKSVGSVSSAASGKRSSVTGGVNKNKQVEELTGPMLMSAVNDFDLKSMAAYVDFCLAQEADPPLPYAVVNFKNQGENSPLHQACQKGKDADCVQLVEMLLKMKADVNVLNRDKQSPLLIAVKRDFPNTVKCLLANGAAFWHKDKDGHLPAHHARDRVIVATLRHYQELKDEADKNAAVAELGEVLFAAVDSNDVKQVKAVIGREPPEETFSYCPAAVEQSSTVLRLAVEKNHLEIVRLLVAAGADGRQCDRLGRTPTMFLCAQKRVPSYPTTKNSRDKEQVRWTLLQALLDGPLMHLECRDKNGDTALLLACNNGYLDDARLLVELGADVNARQVSPYPYRGYPSQREKNGDTALILAARKGDLGVVKALVDELKADVDLHGAEGMTAFMWAVWHGHKDMVVYLHARGANVNAQSWFGQTALMWTMEHMRLDMATLVLDLGYSINSEPPPQPPDESEKKKGDKGKKSPSPTKKEAKNKKGAAAAPEVPILATATVTPGLPPRAADPNIVTRNNASPLVVLCRKAPTMDVKEVSACIDLIISRGANLNIRTTDGLTALMWAVINDDAHIVRSLLFCGADPTIVDNLKLTPLECAKTTVIRMLLKSAVEAFLETKAETEKRAREVAEEMAAELARAAAAAK